MMNKPSIAVLDGDIIAYRAAFWADQEGSEWLEDRIKDDIRKWTPPEVTRVVVAFSCPRSENFRRTWWPQYKAHRDVVKQTPENLTYAESYIKDSYECQTKDHLEADDLMGIQMSMGKAIAVTIDKDIYSVYGWSWKPPMKDTEENPVIFTSKEEADYNFHKQWIMGDVTDNIPGVWKMGQAKAKKLLDSTKPVNHSPLVLSLYEQMPNKDGGKYSFEDALAQARCVRILRTEDWNNQVIPWYPKELK
jgi:hypothetical protein